MIGDVLLTWNCSSCRWPSGSPCRWPCPWGEGRRSRPAYASPGWCHKTSTGRGNPGQQNKTLHTNINHYIIYRVLAFELTNVWSDKQVKVTFSTTTGHIFNNRSHFQNDSPATLRTPWQRRACAAPGAAPCPACPWARGWWWWWRKIHPIRLWKIWHSVWNDWNESEWLQINLSPAAVVRSHKNIPTKMVI